MLILALEASTSSAKALLYDSDRGIIRQEQSSYDSDTASMERMDGDKVMGALLDVGRACAGESGQEVEVIVMSTIWNSLLFYDVDMRLSSAVRTWADLKGDGLWLREQSSDVTVTGCPKSYKFARWQLMRQEEQALVQQGFTIGFLSDYLFYQMTGSWASGRMAAAGSGLLALDHGEWSSQAMEAIGINEAKLPTLVDLGFTGRLTEAMAKRLGLKSGITVAFPYGDGGLNQIYEGGMEKGIMSLSVGTSAAIRMLTNHPIATPENGLWSHYLSKNHYISGGTIAGAGNCVQWFMETQNPQHLSHEALVAMLVEEDLMRAPIFLPFIYGEQSPGWQGQRPWGFIGQGEPSTIGQRYYSVLEGVLFNLYQCYEGLTDTLEPPKEIRVSGGILKSDYWLQLAANVFNRDLTLSPVIHGSLMGAIRLYLGDREYGGQEDLTILKPNRNRIDLMRQRYDRYKGFYKSGIRW